MTTAEQAYIFSLEEPQLVDHRKFKRDPSPIYRPILQPGDKFDRMTGKEKDELNERLLKEQGL